MASLIDVNEIVPQISQVVADQLINYVNTVKNGSITDVEVGSKLWTFIYSSGRQKVDLYYKLYQFKKQSFVLYATGKHLDLHGQERGVFRLQANTAEGIATFYRDQPSPVELKIQQGLEITTTSSSSDDSVITFVTTEPGTIPAGQLSASVSIKCTIPGVDGNLPAGALNRIPNPPSGVHRVVTTSTTGGTKQETDEDYRARIIVALESLGKGTLAAITNAIMSVQGVRTVTITDPTRITYGAEYLLEDSFGTKCLKLEALNATIAQNKITVFVKDGSEAGTKRVEIWNRNENDVEVTEVFDNINTFGELLEKINSTKKGFNLTDGARKIIQLYTILPEGKKLEDIHFEITNGTQEGYKYKFIYGEDIRTFEVYDNIVNVGQLRDELNTKSRICNATTYIEFEERLPITLAVDNDGNEINYIVPTYQPVIALMSDQYDIDGTPYKLENGPIDGQIITVYKDSGIATVRYVYDGAASNPIKIATKFYGLGSNLVKASLYGEKIGSDDFRPIYYIMEQNKNKIPKSIGEASGELGKYFTTIYMNKPGSITVLPVPHALPMSTTLKENVRNAINEVKSAGIESIIEEPKVEFVDVSISVGMNTESGADVNAIKEQIIENLTNYINQLEQNEPAYWERLVAEANPDEEGLLYTEILSPKTDIVPPPGGFLRAGTISFGG